MLSKLFRLLYPPKCFLCNRILKDGQEEVCPDCAKSQGEIPAPRNKLTHVTKWTALWRYQGDVRDSILRFKFGNRQHYGAIYGRLLAAKLQKEDFSCDLLTCVPISSFRKWKRGYDQVLIIGEAMAHEMGIPLVQTLHKHRHTRPQSKLRTAAERRANILGSYSPINIHEFQGKKVLLIDDVITTGATVSECSRILLTHGARSVSCAAVATAIKNNQRSR